MTVGRIEKLTAAIVANPDVRRKERRLRCAMTFNRTEIRAADGRRFLHPKRLDENRQRRISKFLRES